MVMNLTGFRNRKLFFSTCSRPEVAWNLILCRLRGKYAHEEHERFRRIMDDPHEGTVKDIGLRSASEWIRRFIYGASPYSLFTDTDDIALFPDASFFGQCGETSLQGRKA